MAAFFALLAGLAIGFIFGMAFVGVMIATSRSFRSYIVELCGENETED